MTSGGKVTEGLFAGETINTPSLLCVEDYLDALAWADSIGGLPALIARADANAALLAEWVESRDWVDFLASDPKTRSNTSVCLIVVDPAVRALDPAAQAAFAKSLSELLEAEAVAFDIASYRDAPPGLRIWCGGTVEAAEPRSAASLARLGLRRSESRPAQGRLIPAGGRSGRSAAPPSSYIEGHPR